jgi:hypothetical protein
LDPTTLKQNKFLGPAASDYGASGATTASLLGQKEMMQYNCKFFKLNNQMQANSNQESLTDKEIQRNRRQRMQQSKSTNI